MAVAVVRVLPLGVEVRRSCQILTLDLVSSLCQHGNVGVAGVQAGHGVGKGGVSVRGGYVGGGQGRGRSGTNGLGRSHHPLHSRRHVLVLGLLLELLMSLVLLLAFVTPARIGVVVYPGVSGQFIGARKLLAAARELASMGLLSGMGSDVSSLVLQAMESLLAERAFVWTRKLRRGLRRLNARDRPVGLDNRDSRIRHFALSLSRPVVVGIHGRCRWVE